MNENHLFSYIRKWCMVCGLCLIFPLIAYPQQQKISVNIRNLSLKQAMEQISKQAEMNVAYSKEFVDTNKKVSLKVQNMKLEDALSSLLKGMNIGFRFLDNSILLYNKNEQKKGGTSSDKKKEVSVNGQVVDKMTGEPIVGATISVLGTSTGTITDIDGNYSLKVDEGSTLLFSFIGYTEVKQVVRQPGKLDVTLAESAIQLNDVVVVGYGVQKKVNLSGAVDVVKGEALENRPITNVGSGLQGLLPGVSITNKSGQPGSPSMSIMIRGVNTINSSTSPLILIDGVAGGDMNLLNPDDIESVSVLKDAASSAIYGARAANGVILITTKAGKNKEKTTVTYSGYVGVQTPTSLPELVNGREYMELANEAQTAIGVAKPYLQDAFDAYDAGTALNDYSNTDWISEIYKKGAFQTGHNISVSGGTGKSAYYMSYGFLDQDGLIVGDPYSSKRHNIRMNLNTELYDRLKVSGIVSFVDYYRQDCVGSGTGGVFRLAQRMSPLLPIKWMDQNENDGSWYETENWSQGSVTNPLQVAYSDGYGKTNSRALNTIANADLKIAKGLNFNGQYSANYYTSDVKRFSPVMEKYMSDGSPHPGNIGLRNSISGNHTKTLTQSLTATINYQTKIKRNHNLKILGGFSQEWADTETLGASRKNILLDGIEVIDAGTEDINNNGTAYHWALRSFFGRVNYDFNERYLLEANIRYDGTSRFDKNNRWGAFPSVSGAWKFSEEKFMDFSKSFLNLGKVRASWGQLGNQSIGSDYYPYLTPIERVINAYPIGGINNVGFQQLALGNKGIKWETIEMLNIGVDMHMFSNRLLFSFDWFKKKNIDALVRPIYPTVIGITGNENLPLENMGEIQNKGWELNLTWRDQVGQVKYQVSFNLSDAKNEITDLGKSAPSLGNNIRREGDPIDAYYGYLTDGLAQISDFGGRNESNGKYVDPKFPVISSYADIIQPGDIKYRDISGPDGKPDGVINDYDKVVFGDKYPRYSYSLKGELEWKGIDFSFYLQGVGKVNGYLTDEARHCFINDYSIPKKAHLDRWTPNNPGASYPRMYFAQKHNIEFSDYWLENASYLRVKNIQLGYSFPKSMLQKIKANRLRIYVSADNPFTFTNYFSGFDPEVRESSGDSYPQVKTYALGVNISF